MESAAIEPDDRVLDVGCGTGQCAREAARRAFRGAVVGIDLLGPIIRVAEAKAGREGLPIATPSPTSAARSARTAGCSCSPGAPPARTTGSAR
jgi:2-polyprenyl-3-methyl-5-hydroxy-6-metoxy-1,4-benzoquinol methylase